MITKIIFDLDGVLVSERIYWNVADATVQALLAEMRVACFSLEPGAGQGVVPFALIDELKTRGVNSNWDLTHVVWTAALLQAFQKQLPDLQQSLAPKARACDEGFFAAWPLWGEKWLGTEWTSTELLGVLEKFWPKLGERYGHEVMAAWTDFLAEQCPALNDLWRSPLLRNRHLQKFQEKLAESSATVVGTVDAERLRQGFARLQARNIIFGVATGRLYEEAMPVLHGLGIADYFSPDAIATYDDVVHAERTLGQAPLGKPHPYCLLRAVHPGLTPAELSDQDFAAQERPWMLYVGDAGSDLLAAKAAGAEAHMLLTGCAAPDSAPRRRTYFERLGATAIYGDVLDFLNQMESRFA